MKWWSWSCLKSPRVFGRYASFWTKIYLFMKMTKKSFEGDSNVQLVHLDACVTTVWYAWKTKKQEFAIDRSSTQTCVGGCCDWHGSVWLETCFCLFWSGMGSSLHPGLRESLLAGTGTIKCSNISCSPQGMISKVCHGIRCCNAKLLCW